jgi:hypothetical protein
MKDDTLTKLKTFITAVESLAQGVMIHCGIETVTEVIDAAEQLKLELENEKDVY